MFLWKVFLYGSWVCSPTLMVSLNVWGGLMEQAFGPLTDGTIVSRHAVGMLVRMTAMSAHTHLRSLKGRTKPLVSGVFFSF